MQYAFSDVETFNAQYCSFEIETLIRSLATIRYMLFCPAATREGGGSSWLGEECLSARGSLLLTLAHPARLKRPEPGRSQSRKSGLLFGEYYRRPYACSAHGSTQ